jgi:serine/threonine protein phosphatase 1
MLSLLPNAALLQTSGRRPSLPTGLRLYAIGDIHGRLDLLKQLLARVDADAKSHSKKETLHLFLGDYIDRGLASSQTVDQLIAYGKQKQAIFLKGNHEAIALKCLSDPALFDQWMRLGGAETLASYGVSLDGLSGRRPIAMLQAAFHEALPMTHFRFFRDLQISYTCGDFFFAHAGVNPHIELSQQKESDLLWIRDLFLSSSEDFGKIVVHGHTPTREIQVMRNRINIDTGAFATGRLTCLVIDGSELSVICTQ